MTARRALLAFCLAALAAEPALAQGFPAKPIRMVVTYPPGGGADLMARLVAPGIGQALGQSVVVENKAGASGQIAAGDVLAAPADGHAVMLDASSYAVNPCLYPKLPYQPDKAFVPVAILALFPNMLVVTPSHAARDARELVAIAKASPGKVAFASSGNGSAQHLAGELFRQRAGVDMVHVPYKGGGPAMNDVMGGQVPVFFANMASGMQHVKGGKLRALAVTGAQRSKAMPELPTMAEAGVTGYDAVYEWNGIFVKAGTPKETVAKIADAIAKAVQAPEFRKRVEDLGGELVAYGPAEAERFVRAQTELWCSVVRTAKVTLD